MTDLVIVPNGAPLSGASTVPSDKSISHRAIMLAAVGAGKSRVRRFTFGGDNVSTARIFQALGVVIDELPDALVVHGRGLRGLVATTADLDCGNSGTTMRLLCGLLAGAGVPFRMVGDASLSRRPMRRVLEPLARRGSLVQGTRSGTDACAPLWSPGSGPSAAALASLKYDLPTASAQVKSALLLSGLYADGVTDIAEPALSRDHTERMLQALGVAIEHGDGRIKLDPTCLGAGWDGFDITIPGDLSAAAFLLAAALSVPGSAIELGHVGVNPSRAGVLDWMQNAGFLVGKFALTNGEPVATLTARHAAGVAAPLAGGLLVRAIDEVPAICALAASLQGVTRISEAAELRVKESDRIGVSCTVLRAFGLEADERPDGLEVQGKPEGNFKPCDVDSHGDHRIAMMAAVLALRATGPCVVRDVACIDTSFPGFATTLRGLGADVVVRA
jgi:3-phosphoshikimate 1-carboxyvinyltransferase